MNFQKIEDRDRRNADQADDRTARMQDLLFARFGKLVLGRDEIASLLGISNNALKLQELKARARGEQLLPEPLIKTGAGHQWSISQIAAWLAGEANLEAKPAPASSGEVGTAGGVGPRRRGRPRAEERGPRR